VMRPSCCIMDNGLEPRIQLRQDNTPGDQK